MAQRGRHTADLQLAFLLACGASIKEAAKETKLGEATVTRRLKDPEFLKLLDEIKADMVSRTANMLSAAGMRAVKTLNDLQLNDMPPTVRLGAARTIIELGVRLRESVELYKRIIDLEEKLGASTRE